MSNLEQSKLFTLLNFFSVFFAGRQSSPPLFRDQIKRIKTDRITKLITWQHILNNKNQLTCKLEVLQHLVSLMKLKRNSLFVSKYVIAQRNKSTCHTFKCLAFCDLRNIELISLIQVNSSSKERFRAISLFKDVYLSNIFDICFSNKKLKEIRSMVKIDEYFKVIFKVPGTSQKSSQLSKKPYYYRRKSKNFLPNLQMPSSSSEQDLFLDSQIKDEQNLTCKIPQQHRPRLISNLLVPNEEWDKPTAKFNSSVTSSSEDLEFQQIIGTTSTKSYPLLDEVNEQDSVVKIQENMSNMGSSSKQNSSNGPAQIFFESGAHFRGTCNRGAISSGCIEFKNGTKYQGKFKENFFHGYGVLHDKAGRKISCFWDGGHPFGQVRIEYKSGDVYLGEVYHMKKHGRGKLEFNSGNRYEGEFFKGKITGIGCYFKGQQKIYGRWLNGVLQDQESNRMSLQNQLLQVTEIIMTTIQIKSEISSLSNPSRRKGVRIENS